MATSVRHVGRFGAFEFDFLSGELRKHGVKISIQGQPAQILTRLLERPGELVSREELRNALWPDGVFVDFEHSLNAAVKRLRQALNDSPHKPRFVETVARRGYRFVAPLEAYAGPASPGRPAAPAIHSLAVLPFENAGADPGAEYLSDGITESIIGGLSQLPEVRVTARSTVFRYKDKELDPRAAGRKLNVEALLLGRVVQRGESLIVAAELVEVRSGWQLWGEQYNRKLADIFAVQEEISREILCKLRIRLAGNHERLLAKRHTASTEAYRDYLKGRYYWNKMTQEALKKGIVHFQQAIREDPKYALAYVGLSDSYSLFAFFGLLPPAEVMPQAREAVLKALEIDPALAEAHASLAGIKKVWDWDWPGAESEYRRALELNPNYETAHRWYADFLCSMGRPEEALRAMLRAQELDPLSLIIGMELAWTFYMARQYPRAIEQALKAIEMEWEFKPAHHVLGLAYEQSAKHELAIAAFLDAQVDSEPNPANLAALGHVFAVTGRDVEAGEILTQLRALSRQSYVSSFWPALIHTGLGNGNAAFEWLEKACQERDVWLVWLKVDPRLDPLRSDPRFDDLLRRVGLKY